MDDSERKCLEMLKVDTLSPFVPHIDQILYDKEENNCKDQYKINTNLIYRKSYLIISFRLY